MIKNVIKLVSTLMLCTSCYEAPVCYDTASCNPGAVRGLKSFGGTDRDLITTVSANQNANITKTADLLAKKYSLSATTSLNVAHSLIDWNKLSNRTEADLADFSKRLYGIDIKKVNSALVLSAQGNNSELDQTIAEAAVNWGTTPENMKNIIKDFHGNELREMGVEL